MSDSGWLASSSISFINSTFRRRSARRRPMGLLVVACLAIFWFAVFFEYTPLWEKVYDADRVYINLLWALATGGLVIPPSIT